MSGVSFVLATPRIDRARISRGGRGCSCLTRSSWLTRARLCRRTRLRSCALREKAPFRVRDHVAKRRWSLRRRVLSRAHIAADVGAPTASLPHGLLIRLATGEHLNRRLGRSVRSRRSASPVATAECEAGDDVEPVVVACRDHGERDPRRPGEP